MSKVDASGLRVPSQYDRTNILPLFGDIARQVNAISEGRLAGSYNALTAAPTGGTYAVGDFVRNKTPTEAGAGGSKYVVFGWICVTAGTPGTWLPCRYLTGN